MATIRMEGEIRKSGNSLMMKLSKKDFKELGILNKYKPGVKIIANISFIEDDDRGYEPNKDYNPFSTEMDISEDEIPDEPTGVQT